MSIQGTDLIFISDESGQLTPAGSQTAEFPLADGEWKVEILRGNARLTQVLRVDANKALVVDLTAMGSGREAGAKKMERLSVSGGEARKDQGRQVITASELRTMPGAGGDLLRGVENLPGVLKASFNESGMYIRGSGRDDMAYRLGLMRIGDPFHLVLLSQYSVFPGSMLDRVEFFPGGYPSYLGGVQGGILQVFPKTEWADRAVHGEVDVNLVTASAYLTVPIGPLRLTASARRTYFEAYMGVLRLIPALPDYLKYAFSQVPTAGDYYAEAAFTPDAHHRLSVKALGSLDNLEIKTDQFPVTDGNGETNFVEMGNGNRVVWDAQGLEWSFQRDGLRLEAVGSHLKSSFFASTFGSVYMAITNETLQGTLHAVLPLGPRMRLDAGVECVGERFWGTLRDPEPGSETNLNPANFPNELASAQAARFFFTNAPVRSMNPGRTTLTPWLEWQADLGPVSFSVGTRFTWNPALSVVDWEPRLEVGVPLWKDFSFFARAGRYSQYPPFLTWDRFGLIHEQAPTDLLPYTLQASGGLEGKVSGVQVKMEGYYKRFVDQPLPNPTFDPLYRTNAQEDPTSVLVGTGRALGLEILLRKSLGKYFTGWLTYALAVSTHEVFPETNNLYVLSDASNNGMDWRKIPLATEPMPQDTTHVVRALVSFKPSPRFQIGTRLSVKSGAPYTKKLVQWFDGSTTNSLPNGVVNVGELRYVDDTNRYTERYPFAFYWDVRLDWNIPVGKRGGEFHIYLDLWNIQVLFGGNQTSYAYDQRALRDLTLADWKAFKNTGDRVAVPASGILGSDPVALPIPMLGVSYTF
ncbi:MAG: hypothetical protein J0L75_11770 [Spirochaetes bacterium]|nr:hypothetical protein [Spirochaetota bacterium]